MKNSVLHFLLPALAALLAFGIQAASVDNNTGYTNDFSVRPAASDWATRAIGSTGMTGSGEVTTVAAMDAAVLTNTAALINTQPASATGVPPNNAAAAVKGWLPIDGKSLTLFIANFPCQNIRESGPDFAYKHDAH